MEASPESRRAWIRSLAVHGALLLSISIWALAEQILFPVRELPPPEEFTIVLPPAAQDEPREKPFKTIEDNAPKVPDALNVSRPKPKPKVKPKPKPKPKPEPEKKKPFVKGKRVEGPKFDAKRLKSDLAKENPLTKKQIEEALRNGARAGTRNQLPDSEQARCVSAIRNALYNAWLDMPSRNDVGDRRVQLEIRLSRSGRIASYRLVGRSGIAAYDNSVLKAAARVGSIPGLTQEFLKQYERLTIEFNVE